MRIVFRADASSTIGVGHVMRCLALAEAVREQGGDVSFVSREEPGHIIATIERRGFAVTRLPADPWDAVIDASRTAAAASDAEWVVVDRHGLDQNWDQVVGSAGARVFAFDDEALTRRRVDILLNQNYLPGIDRRYAELNDTPTQVLLGPRYAPLASMWAEEPVRHRDGSVERILISFGGADPNGDTVKAVEAIRLLPEEALQVDVVVGPANRHAAAIQERAAGSASITVHPPQESLLSLTDRADLVIGALGVATWERMSRGVPSIVVVIADNQATPATTLGEDGYVLNLGDTERVSAATIAAAVSTMRASPALVRFMGERGRELVDGRGGARVARRLTSVPVAIRLATEEDSERLLRWRNDEETRANSFVDTPVAKADHEAWLSGVLQSRDRTLLIGERNGDPSGMVRFDHNGEEALVSLTVAPSARGEGTGHELLRVAQEWIVQHRPELRTLLAEIKPGNDASTAIFSRLGYRETKRSLELHLVR